MKRNVMIMLVMAAIACTAGSAHALVMKFDFEPAGNTPETGFIHVDETTVYSPGQGYGIYTDPGYESESTWTRDRGSVCPYEQYTDFVAMGNHREFLVDVPNGDYYVTAAAGDASYSMYSRIYIEGENYGWDYDAGPQPTGAPVYLAQHSFWGSDLEQVAIPNSAWRDAGWRIVRTLGYTHTGYTDEDSKTSEYLLVDKLMVTVTDGQISVENNWGNGNLLNFVIIETVPEPATCLLLVLGSIALRRKR